MTVEINHKEVDVPEDCLTLGDLLQAQGIDGKGRAIAVDNRVVPRVQWDTFPLADHMKITIIRAVCGG